MRLIMAQWRDGQTTTDRQRAGGESAASRRSRHRHRTIARRPSRAATGSGIGNPRADRCDPRRGPGDGSAIATALSPVGAAASDAAAVGRAAQGVAEPRARSGVSRSVGRAGQGGGGVGALADPSGLGATPGPPDSRFGGVAALGSTRVAQTRSRYAPPQERSGGAGGVEKNSPKRWLPS